MNDSNFVGRFVTLRTRGRAKIWVCESVIESNMPVQLANVRSTADGNHVVTTPVSNLRLASPAEVATGIAARLTR